MYVGDYTVKSDEPNISTFSLDQHSVGNQNIIDVGETPLMDQPPGALM